jgi:hypothetical protein
LIDKIKEPQTFLLLLYYHTEWSISVSQSNYRLQNKKGSNTCSFTRCCQFVEEQYLSSTNLFHDGSCRTTHQSLVWSVMLETTNSMSMEESILLPEAPTSFNVELAPFYLMPTRPHLIWRAAGSEQP